MQFVGVKKPRASHSNHMYIERKTKHPENTVIFFENTERIKYLTMTDAKKVWMPDTFFRNEKEGRFHNILVPNVYIRIFPNGDVLYSIR